nr:sugar transferase [Phaeovulum sp. NW3]
MKVTIRPDEIACDGPFAAGAVVRNRYTGAPQRMLDLLLVLIMVPALVPVIAVLCLLVRLDGGPCLFAQPRVGRDGRLFRCWKLRSMAVDAEDRLRDLCARDPAIAREWQAHQKLRNDPRITRIGAFLRKSSLDELPQIFNILSGDMSFVGPRPFTPDQQPMYEAAGGRAYFRMRPGVTGLWQLEGRGTTLFIDRVRYDEAYYRRASLRTDLMLIARTGLAVVKMTGQ